MRALNIFLFVSLFFTLSCNVVQMIKQDKGEVPDDFFRGGHHGDGPQDTMTFFQCSGNPCYFDTQSEQVTMISNHTGTQNYYPFAGAIYFSDATQVLKFDFNSTTVVDNAITGKSFTEYQGHLFFLGGDNTIRVVSNFDGTAKAPTGSTLSTPSWIQRVYDSNSGDKLVICAMNGTQHLMEVTIDSYDGNGDPATYSLVSLQDQTPASVACDSSSNEGFVRDSHILRADSGGVIHHFNISTPNYYTFSATGGPAVSINISYDGSFFYQDWDGSNYFLKRYDFYNGTSGQTLVTSFTPSNLIPVIDSPDEFYYINKDGNGVDQLFRMMKGSAPDSGELITNFTNDGSTIMHMEVGSGGFYIFKQGGIWKWNFFENSVTQVSTTTVTNAQFKTYSYDQIYWNNCTSCATN